MEKVVIGLALTALMGSLFFLENFNNQDFSEFPNHIVNKFNNFKLRYSKTYSGAEDKYRLGVYMKNLAEIEAHNQGNATYKKGENQFADLTKEEFESQYLTNLVFTEEDMSEGVKNILADIPAEVDHRGRGVTPIKNQGACGSCWAFATIALLEGNEYKYGNKMEDLSEQQLVDCSGIAQLNLGCNGGMPARALWYVKKHGITTTAEYGPYQAKKGTCRIPGGKVNFKRQYNVANDYAALRSEVTQQPVAVGVNASNWQFYKEGIFNDCSADGINHAVTAVGFKHGAQNAENHLRIKNSWGTTWGEEGFVRLAPGNTCGVQQTVVSVE